MNFVLICLKVTFIIIDYILACDCEMDYYIYYCTKTKEQGNALTTVSFVVMFYKLFV